MSGLKYKTIQNIFLEIALYTVSLAYMKTWLGKTSASLMELKS